MKNYDSYVQLGDANLASGDLDKALFYYGKVLAVIADDDKVRAKMATVYARRVDDAASRGEYEAAQADFRKCFEYGGSESARNKVIALFRDRVNQLVATGRLDEAKAAGDTVLALAPDASMESMVR